MVFSKSMVFAVLGLLVAVFYINNQQLAPSKSEPLRPPASKPYQQSIAGTGLVEPWDESFSVAPNTSGKVAKVFVKTGDFVEAGQALFSLDTDQLALQQGAVAAQAQAAMAHVASLQAQLQRQAREPRPESLPPFIARAKAAKASYEREAATLRRLQGVSDSAAVSANEVQRQQQLVAECKARLEEAQAELSFKKAGTWSLELQSTKAALAEAQAMAKQSAQQLAQLRLQVAQSVVRAPKAGQVLQMKVKEGETFQLMQMGGANGASVVMGDMRRLQIRVDIDEVLAAEVKPNMKATAFIKGNSRLRFPLSFVRLEPLMVPKQNLTGATAERNDVRVLQLIYTFTMPKQFAVYPGQQVEVYLDKETTVSDETLTPATNSTPQEAQG
jgi:multidrug resistance efflux pump